MLSWRRSKPTRGLLVHGGILALGVWSAAYRSDVPANQYLTVR